MSEHAWTVENLAAYVAGGLEPHERERLNSHIAECAMCNDALDAARGADRRLMALFANIRPGPALEDRLVRTLRHENRAVRRSARPMLWAKIVLAAAAVALMAVTGAVVCMVASTGGEEAGAPEAQSRNWLKQIALGTRSMASIQDHFAREGKDKEAEGRAFPDPNTASPDELVEEIRAQTLAGLKHSIKLQIKTENGRDSFLGVDGVPRVQVFDSDIDSRADRKADVTAKMAKAAGGNSYSRGFRDGEKGAPPVNLPMPAPAGTLSPQSPPALGRPAPAGVPSSSNGTFGGFGLGQGGALVMDDNKKVTKTLPPVGNHLPSAEFFFNPHNTFGEKPSSSSSSSATSRTPVPTAPTVPVAPGLNTNQVPATGIPIPPAASTPAPQDQPKAVPRPAIPPGKSEGGDKKPEPVQPTPTKRYIIRTGQIEFEIDSFDAAVVEIQTLVAATKGGYIATINSDKLPNGKVRGAIVVRVPPEQLDKLILDLRRELGKKGELKGQRIGSDDVSKKYTDFESELKAARSMEERLLRIIKEGKGEIKDLIVAEKELGVWRTKIEKVEGELRYYSNLISLSTLTINLSEKEIRVAAAVMESERVQAGIEVEDVEKAMREVLKAVEEAKGRVTRSEMKQHSAGQFTAQLEFEVAPEAAGPVRDRLKQLGTVARLEIDRVQTAEGGEKLPQDGKLRRGNTRFFVSLYNLVNITPRETVSMRLNADNVATAYATLRAAIVKAKGRIADAKLNEQDRQNLNAILTFVIRRDEEPVIQAALAGAGEVLSRQVSRTEAKDNVTDTNVLYSLELIANAAARETVTLKFAATDVATAYRAIRDALGKANARVINATLNENDRHNVGGQLDFDLRRTDEGAVIEALTKAGEVVSRHVSRAADTGNVTDKKVFYKVEFIPATAIEPREVVAMAVEVHDVEGTISILSAQVKELQGRVIKGPEAAHEANGRVTAYVVYDVPLSAAPAIAEKLRNSGQVRASRTVPNSQAPEGKLAMARFNVTLMNANVLLPTDEGMWHQVRSGLSWALRGLSLSLSVLIVGVVLVVPWLVLLVAVFWLIRRIWRPTAAPAPTGPVTPTTPAAPA